MTNATDKDHDFRQRMDYRKRWLREQEEKAHWRNKYDDLYQRYLRLQNTLRSLVEADTNDSQG